MRCMLLWVLAATALMAADATGKWTGTLTVPTPEGERAGPAHLVLKQEGSRLTGTAGPRADDQQTIEQGQAQDGSLRFQVSRNDWVMKFDLRQDGDEINGAVTRERDGRTESGKLSVKREN